MSDTGSSADGGSGSAAPSPQIQTAVVDQATSEGDALLMRLQMAQAAAGIGIHDYDILRNTIDWDERVRSLWGIGPQEPISYETFAAGVHSDDLPSVEQAIAAATDPSGEGQYFARYRVTARSGEMRHIEATGRTMFQDGIAVRLIGTVRDVTQEVTTRAELEAARTFAENLVQSAPTLLYVYDLVNHRNVFIGPQIGPLTNMSQQHYAELGGDLLPAVIHPDDMERVTAHHHAIREGYLEPPFEIEYRLRRADGGWVWLSSREVVHARDETGKPTQILGASVDITRRHEAEALRELLIGEMAHRIRNLLGVFQSIARLTLREGCAPETWSGFERRLDALVAAQRLLTDGDWQSAELGEVVRVVLQPFALAEARITFSGPSVRIEGGQVATVALAMHELATNAVKHGALSVPEGWVEITWTRSGMHTELEWRERGGPPARVPERFGFGTRMINALGRRDTSNRWTFGEDGLVCRISL